MMKKFFVSLIFVSVFLTANAQPLGHKCGQLWADAVIFSHGLTYQNDTDFHPDLIYGIYVDIDGTLRASDAKPAYGNNQYYGMILNNVNDVSYCGEKVGMSPGDDKIYGAWFNNEMHLINLDIVTSDDWFSFAHGLITDSILGVQNNNYYKLHPIWQPSEVSISETPFPGDKISLVYTRPENYTPDEISWHVEDGTGYLYYSRFKPHYQLSKGDIDNGHCKIRTIVEPLADAVGSVNEVVFTYTWPQPVTNLYPYPDLTLKQWNIYIRYYLEVINEGGYIVLKQKYGNRLCPAFKAVVKWRDKKYNKGPLRLLETSEQYDGKPNYKIKIPETMGRMTIDIYHPVNPSYHKNWNWKK